MNENHDENVHFKMRMDGEVEDSVIPAQVDELRIEKLSHRITLISILIPVLIVVILGIAYIDIKRRVIHTEDTGAVTVQHLSEDLESRFSSLSLSQAHLEEALAKFQDQTNQSLAKAQVHLEKIDGDLKKSSKAMVSQKEIKSVSEKMDQRLANVAQSTEDLKAQVESLSQSIQSRLSQLDQQTAELGPRMSKFTETLTNLEKSKMDKNAMEMAIKLEILKTKQIFNAQIDDIQARIQSLERKIAKTPVARPATPKAQPPAAPADDLNSGKLKEQTISN